MNDKDSLYQLQTVATADDVAALFGLTYKQLARIFYKTSAGFQYRTFSIKKKSGGTRELNAPNRKIKAIQRRLAAMLQAIHEPRPSVHGFTPRRSIVTNASKHLNKRFVFNIDLQDFFGTLHFGRIRNMFEAKPFEIPRTAAIVLAHICCFVNRLPQGAPTSPIITNIICRKLDRQCQALAKEHRATYTRYADDLTFSFTCTRGKLPKVIVNATEDGVAVGEALNSILTENGFVVNDQKTRLRGRAQRLEVTGLTVNEFVNVPRDFIRCTSSMLYAWKKFGIEAASQELFLKYVGKLRERASEVKPDFKSIVKGRMAYIHMVRGPADPIYLKLAKRFNELEPDSSNRLPIVEISGADKELSDAIFVVEALYDDQKGNHASQGTGFLLKNVGFVTAAHVVSHGNEPFKEVTAHTFDKPFEIFGVKVKWLDTHRDLAICALVTDNGKEFVGKRELTAKVPPPNQGGHIKLMGFPNYKLGQTLYVAEGTVASFYPLHGVDKMEITSQIREGNSGGPVLNLTQQVVGVAVEGADKASGNNAVVLLSELHKFLDESTAEK